MNAKPRATEPIVRSTPRPAAITPPSSAPNGVASPERPADTADTRPSSPSGTTVWRIVWTPTLYWPIATAERRKRRTVPAGHGERMAPAQETAAAGWITASIRPNGRWPSFEPATAPRRMPPENPAMRKPNSSGPPRRSAKAGTTPKATPKTKFATTTVPIIGTSAVPRMKSTPPRSSVQ